jgi:hypothetical protein
VATGQVLLKAKPQLKVTSTQREFPWNKQSRRESLSLPS